MPSVMCISMSLVHTLNSIYLLHRPKPYIYPVYLEILAQNRTNILCIYTVWVNPIITLCSRIICHCSKRLSMYRVRKPTHAHTCMPQIDGPTYTLYVGQLMALKRCVLWQRQAQELHAVPIFPHPPLQCCRCTAQRHRLSIAQHQQPNTQH